MRLKILIIFSLLIASSAHAQSRAKYTPKLPNFFEASKPRGELISVEQIVATKVDKSNQQQDSFAVDNTTSEKPLMGNPLGILPKKQAQQQTVQTEVPKQEVPQDATTAELQEAVNQARQVSEEIKQNMGGDVDYTNPKHIEKFVNASEKALQRGQLKTQSNNKTQEQDYKF